MSRTATAEQVRVVIATELTPYLGKTMAESSAQLYLDRLGSSSAAIGEAQRDQLLAWIGPGLKVFLGEARAAQVVADLKVALTRLWEGP